MGAHLTYLKDDSVAATLSFHTDNETLRIQIQPTDTRKQAVERNQQKSGKVRPKAAEKVDSNDSGSHRYIQRIYPCPLL